MTKKKGGQMSAQSSCELQADANLKITEVCNLMRQVLAEQFEQQAQISKALEAGHLHD